MTHLLNASKINGILAKAAKNLGPVERAFQRKSKILDFQPGKLISSYKIDENELNFKGQLSPGTLTSIVDSTTTILCMTGDARLAGVSTKLSLTTLKPVEQSTTELRLESTFLQEQEKIAFLETRITSSDGAELFAIGQHTKYLHPRSRGMFPSAA
ncbi:Oidioi.mRNA.OKI2018_I69.PAR.g12945.t1.cds [Oikopleura dioica]|uniref:Oidioi.mRNA.OKI2018_I69.PAR.g12945.t1.cds n=1 Tax=Oikopleura dioica TaxID=34765 RepID=A0ABN7S6C2_OIKDI|nr:Oidioi.mRNA.OKI2018_I69.PAR.g12945.t1.cds [Oikopleura dioica]